MIKIGDFARLGQVSVATLRHYDELGLLKPVAVDNLTAYRYYSIGQLPRLNRILALKDLGFSLEQIDAVLNGLTLDQLRGMLKLRHAEAADRVAQEQARLSRIAARLRHIESEDTLSNYDVVLKTVPSMLVVARRITIPTNDQAGDFLGKAYGEAYGHVHQHGAKDVGPCLAVWHQPASVHENEEAEAIVPIDRRIPGTEQVRVYELPQEQVAAVVHNGPFENLTPTHTAILTWVEANGYRVTGPYREVYLRQQVDGVEETATEIQYPVVQN